MFKKTMTFDDLDGNEVTQTFYFNYTKKEIAELLEFQELEEKIQRLTQPIEESGLTEQENAQQAYDIFQDLILGAYGEKGADNVTFRKTPELREYFASHVAFVDMIFEFVANPKLATDFMEGCLPPRLVAKAKEEMVAQGAKPGLSIVEMSEEAERRQKDPATKIEPGLESAPAEVVRPPAPVKNIKELTERDIMEMDLVTLNRLDENKLSKSQLLAAFRRKSELV